MKIQTFKFNNQTVNILFLNEASESRLLSIENFLRIIEWGQPFVCFENINFTRHENWEQQGFQLIKGLDSERYFIRKIEGLDIALKKADVPQLMAQIWSMNPYIYGICLKDRYLPFRLNDKMASFGEQWQRAYHLLNGFEWNLHFCVGERSYFATPDEALLEQIMALLQLNSAHATHEELCSPKC